MNKFALLIISLYPFLLFSQSNLDSLYRWGIQKDWSVEQIDAYKKWEALHFKKPSEGAIRQNAIMNGNKITTEIWNFGSISAPGNRITDIVWEGLGYGYEFGPFVGAEVPVPKGSHPDAQIKRDENGNIITDANGDTIWVAHVISDGLKSNGGEVSPDGLVRWGWEPLLNSDDGLNDFMTLESTHIPTSDDRDRNGDGKPDSWPDSWYNETLRSYVWPGALGQGATNADKEAFFVMDDRDNKEFQYFPYPGDTLRQGLGLEVEARIYQWSNVEAEDAIFLIYKIKNKGYYDLEKAIFGMWGDPHIGGPDDWRDDWANFDKKLEMTFAWDADGKSVNNPDIVPGYLGYKFLESPGNSTDGIDNDEDGMIDESWTDGIDNDGDWDPETDDVGIDGIPNTGDLGEKDGIPTAGDPFDITKPGEPNYEFTDIDESDMIGLTSFAQPEFSGLHISDDELIWREHIQPGNFDTTQVQGDYVFLYGSGIFTLSSIHTVSSNELNNAIKRFSIALIIGEDKDDLVLNAKTVQRIYNSGYQFAKPPAKPYLTVIPGDKKVTLYWDDRAEKSVDPISKELDFEGYIIYRSTDPGFLDQQTITDMNGNKFLFEPLRTSTGGRAQFDLENGIVGASKVVYQGRGMSFYLGDDTGLRHSFVDSNNVINGQTYFYAVVSYDHGSDSLGIPPAQCSMIITYDPTTDEYTFDVNTAKVIPRTKAAGYTPPTLKNADVNDGIERISGYSTGHIKVDIIDERKVKPDNRYNIIFSDTAGTEYSIEDTQKQEEIFTSFYDNFVELSHQHLIDTTIIVTDLAGSTVFTEGIDYELDPELGAIKVFDPAKVPGARMEDNTDYKIQFKYFPVYRSKALNGELTNPIFDGLRLSVKEAAFKLNEEYTGWSTSSQTTLDYFILNKKRDLKDYEFIFSSDIVDTSVNGVLTNFTITDVINNEKAKYYIFDVAHDTIPKDNIWEPDEKIWLFSGGLTVNDVAWEIYFPIPDSNYVPPTKGDVFYLATDKPFAGGDIFSFTTIAARIDTQKAKSGLDNIRVVPNPYVATNVIEPINQISRTTRGYRRLYFDHLPARCTIRIYTQAGELVKVLEHDSGIDDGKEFWDLLTKDNMEVAYGLYFFHVDAPGIGEKVGKFVIIK